MNITYFQATNFDGSSVDWVQIEIAPNQFTSMPKSVYDAQQAASTLPSELSTPTTPQAGA
jgi:hypothetical protein